jgi:hypothetical protein
MTVAVELVERDGALATFKGRGEAEGGAQTVSAKLTLTCANLRDRNPALQAADERIVTHLRGLHALLRGDLRHGLSAAG